MSVNSPGSNPDRASESPPREAESNEDPRLRDLRNEDTGSPNNEDSSLLESTSNANNTDEIAAASLRQAEGTNALDAHQGVSSRNSFNFNARSESSTSIEDDASTGPNDQERDLDTRANQDVSLQHVLDEHTSPPAGIGTGANVQESELGVSDHDLHDLINELGLTRMRYKCGECGQFKVIDKDGVRVPHFCPKLRDRVNGWALNKGKTISDERTREILKLAEERMMKDDAAAHGVPSRIGRSKKRDPTTEDDAIAKEASQSPKRKRRGPYLCGRCRVPKKGHICPYAPHKLSRGDDEEGDRKPAARQRQVSERAEVNQRSGVQPSEATEDEDDRKPAAQPQKPVVQQVSEKEEDSKPAGQARQQLATEVHAEAESKINVEASAEDSTTIVAERRDRSKTDDSPEDGENESTQDQQPAQNPEPAVESDSEMQESTGGLRHELVEPLDKDRPISGAPEVRSPQHDEEDDDVLPAKGNNPSPP